MVKRSRKSRSRFEASDIIHVGLDDLELYFLGDNPFRFEFETHINIDGSPEGEIVMDHLRFKYTLGHAPSGYERSIKFFLLADVYHPDTDTHEPDAFNVFSLFWGTKDPNIKIKGKNKAVFHSTFFMYLERFIGVEKNYGWLHDFITRNFRIDFSKPHLHRFDICVDIANLKKQDIIPYFNPHCFSGRIGAIKDQPGYFETDYIKRKSSDKNRNYLIRLYDKIEDTRVKRKWALFDHLNTYEAVTRIEIEFRSDFCDILTNPKPEWCAFDAEDDVYTIITAEDLLLRPSDFLGSLFYSKISKFTPLFDRVNGWKQLTFQPYPKSKSKLARQFLECAHIPADYMKRFLGYARSILENTGHLGYSQAVLGVVLDDRRNTRRRNKKVASDLLKSPERFIREMLRYACAHLSIDRLKLNDVLRDFIFTPSYSQSKIHAKQTKLLADGADRDRR